MEYLILVFITSALVTLYCTPPLLKVAVLKKLFDVPDDDRKMHKRAIPTIGGIIIFAATLFAYSLWYPVAEVASFKYLVCCMLILFFVGIKDDIIGTAPIKKLIAQLIVALILVVLGDIKIIGLHGLFNVRELPLWGSFILSVFTIIVIINAYNLIDGIDGLASGIGLISAAAYGVYFYMADNLGMSCLAFALCGSLFSFLIFNFSPAKIFMGDSGSLTIGLVIAVLTINIIEQNPNKLPLSILHVNKPVFAMAVLVYPLYDTLRVFLHRAIRGLSPFSADNKHIHHRLLKVGCNHKKIAMLLYASSVSVILLSVLLTGMDSTITFCIVFLYTAFLAQIPFWMKKKPIAKPLLQP
jgi:UDP-GlcNAc:undecaprenyl-phosphate GlcNAc-1-phosphate transferase